MASKKKTKKTPAPKATKKTTKPSKKVTKKPSKVAKRSIKPRVVASDRPMAS
jgi:hypothetical protein